jgi:DNA-binding protein H-NS
MPKTKSTTLTSAELVKQSEALRQQAESMKAKEKPQVVASIKEAIAHYGLTAADLGLGDTAKAAKQATKKAGKTTAPKKAAVKTDAKKAGPKKRTSKQYRDAAGNTWSGFGPRPQWLKDALAGGATEESLLA